MRKGVIYSRRCDKTLLRHYTAIGGGKRPLENIDRLEMPSWAFGALTLLAITATAAAQTDAETEPPPANSGPDRKDQTRASRADMRIARIRLSDKISRLHPRWAAAELGQAYEPEVLHVKSSLIHP